VNWWRRERAVPDARGADSGEFHSRALGVLTHALKEPRKHQVLDLGGPTGANVSFFELVSCRLHFAGLDELVTDAHAAGRGFPLALSSAELEGLFAFDDELRFDVVLGWDLFNYLDESALDRAFERIRRHCQANSLLFFLIATTAQMPALPTRYGMSRDGRLHWARGTSAVVEAPRYTPRDLARRMTGFEVLHMSLLQDGVQEYACRFQYADAGAVQAVADPSRVFTRGRLA
jgi:hypothetical protein